MSSIISTIQKMTFVVTAFGCISIISGCGGDGGESAESVLSVEEQAAVESQAELKVLLQTIATTGEGGSAIAGIGSSIENLTIDDAKKQSLMKGYEYLNNVTDPNQVKSVATQMASQL